MKVRGGFTLAEVVVSMLIAAVMVTAVMGVAISNKAGGIVQDHRLVATPIAQQLLLKLKNYVTSDPGTNTLYSGLIDGPSVNSTTCTSSSGRCTWSLNTYPYTDQRDCNDLGNASCKCTSTGAAGGGCTGCGSCSPCTNCYALDGGSHTITGPNLPPAPPLLSNNASVTYWVCWKCGSAACTTTMPAPPIPNNCMPQVSVTVLVPTGQSF